MTRRFESGFDRLTLPTVSTASTRQKYRPADMSAAGVKAVSVRVSDRTRFTNRPLVSSSNRYQARPASVSADVSHRNAGRRLFVSNPPPGDCRLGGGGGGETRGSTNRTGA